MQGEARKQRLFALTPRFIVYTYPAKRSEAMRIHQATKKPTCFAGKKFILHSRIRLFRSRPAHVVLMGPLQWRLLWLYGRSLHWRGPEIKIFSVFDSTSVPVGRPSRVGRALGALRLKPGLE
uniref:Uncharacterized protein n=1 Tax=Pleurozia purpurea TaxID=280637 RepID=D0R041_9MARC|nr:hypothetical protein PlpuMp42 [Pleurozia purpurea]ACR19378.1 hypothetical protein PlpuMp42 [Pleurozia purpurea]